MKLNTIKKQIIFKRPKIPFLVGIKQLYNILTTGKKYSKIVGTIEYDMQSGSRDEKSHWVKEEKEITDEIDKTYV